MLRFFRIFPLLFLCVPFCLPSHSWAADAQTPRTPDNKLVQSAAWTSFGVHHAYGLPDTKPKQKGKLTVNLDGVTFASESGNIFIPRRSIMAVSAGSSRVELWGAKGRILRMVIPEGGGLAAAGVLHHNVGMLTIEFRDDKGAYHGAVFFMVVDKAEQALQTFSWMPAVHRESRDSVCQNAPVLSRSVLVEAPSWEQTEVPAAYRVLVYERLIDRLKHSKGVGHVYRDGENEDPHSCPNYTIHISIAGFKKGSQVARSMTGPVGFFVGTTQMNFDSTITDASGQLNTTEQIKAAARGDSESITVADNVAKKLAKHYQRVHEKFEQTSTRNSSNPHIQN